MKAQSYMLRNRSVLVMASCNVQESMDLASFVVLNIGISKMFPNIMRETSLDILEEFESITI